MSRSLVKEQLLALLGAAAVMVPLTRLDPAGFATTYESIRSDIFSGLMTLGALLFGVYTFIVVKVKEDVYDTPEYARRADAFRRAFPQMKHYGPLTALSARLEAAVFASMLGAALQFSLGLVSGELPAVVCAVFAVWACIVLVLAFVSARRNFKFMIDFAEEQREREASMHPAPSARTTPHAPP